MVNKDNKINKYQANKLIKFHQNGSGYISIPKWLTNNEILIIIDNTKYIKKTTNTPKITFPSKYVGIRVKIEYPILNLHRTTSIKL